ncbi:MAG: TonB-dependent receptor [Flavisolibacter sp.]
MSILYKTLFLLVLTALAQQAYSQNSFKGKVVDAATGKPLQGASVRCDISNCDCGCSTRQDGSFEMNCTCETHFISSTGYAAKKIRLSPADTIIGLQPQSSVMEELVVTANRGESRKRSESPVAIGTITPAMLQDARAASADQVLNKVSGVNMVSHGNEQHQMSIRQPITTKSLFLYLEDGIPIRTTGLYNHNALLEMNMAATGRIEVIKGPSSSLYGSEAIGGVVNFITTTPSATPALKVSAQGNNLGYKRGDFNGSTTVGNWGFLLAGYYADKNNSNAYNNFHKGTLTAKADYRFSPATRISNQVTWLDYYSDMSGTVDSTLFANCDQSKMHTFTYRKVNGLRFRSTLDHDWNNGSRSSITALLRDNSIGQNPAYRVKDDYKKVNGRWVGDKSLAHGEINESRFQSLAVLAQHRQKFGWKNASIIAGLNADLSPSTYDARYIRIQKDTVSRKYVSYQSTDSVLTNYKTKLDNYAAFGNFEFSPWEKVRVVASLRYDFFRYRFDNQLAPSAFSGATDTVTNFSRLSPKIGFTWNFSRRAGVYANYSEGFVPPQVTELFTGVKVPKLSPSTFYNYEAGGWVEIVRGKVSGDISLYQLQGTNEIVNVKQDDGSFANENAGKTLHRGVEWGLKSTPFQSLSLRVSGAYSEHSFVDFVEKGVSYNGREMNNAPHWVYNAEAWWKPAFVKGLRLGAEWQHVGRYFADPQNTATYQGYDALNLRGGYRFGAAEVWLNVMNATDAYYATTVSKSSFGYSYQVADPRSFNLGFSIDLAQLSKKQ